MFYANWATILLIVWKFFWIFPFFYAFMLKRFVVKNEVMFEWISTIQLRFVFTTILSWLNLFLWYWILVKVVSFSFHFLDSIPGNSEQHIFNVDLEHYVHAETSSFIFEQILLIKV